MNNSINQPKKKNKSRKKGRFHIRQEYINQPLDLTQTNNSNHDNAEMLFKNTSSTKKKTTKSNSLNTTEVVSNRPKPLLNHSQKKGRFTITHDQPTPIINSLNSRRLNNQLLSNIKNLRVKQ